jgi:hypothetical protein
MREASKKKEDRGKGAGEGEMDEGGRLETREEEIVHWHAILLLTVKKQFAELNVRDERREIFSVAAFIPTRCSSHSSHKLQTTISHKLQSTISPILNGWLFNFLPSTTSASPAPLMSPRVVAQPVQETTFRLATKVNAYSASVKVSLLDWKERFLSGEIEPDNLHGLVSQQRMQIEIHPRRKH